MFADLLIKDAKRMRQNPWPILIFLAIPLCLTALIGVAFGPNSESSGLGQIKLAVVDEDGDFVGGLLRSAFNQGDAQEYFAPQVLSRSEAEALLNDNKISAMVVIPETFTGRFFRGESPPPLELVKNPAQSFHPAIVEELLGVVAEVLSAASSVFGSELRAASDLFEENDRFDFRAMAELSRLTGERLEGVEDFLLPPLISYTTSTGEEEQEAGAGEPANDEANPRTQIFTYILPGMAAMFLLMVGDGSTRDLYKEVRFGTLNRYRTLRSNLLLFLLAKIMNSLWVMLACALILFGGGWLIFGIQWNHPFWLSLLSVAFSLCACGFLTLLAALARSEKRADTMNSAIVLGLAFVGGSMVPVNALPGFVRQFISPLTPNYWFIESVRRLQNDVVDSLVINSCIALTLAGLVLAAVSAWRFNRVLREGIRE